MVRLLEGVVHEATDRSMILMTAGGVGYLINKTSRTRAPIGENVRLYTHLAVRENALDLYGFEQHLELDFFELLLTIPKIGPKSALSILEQASMTLICEAVTTGDAGRLSKLTGMGKKTAEKLVQELAGKIEMFSIAIPAESNSQNAFYQDAFDTLVTLGYNPTEIRQVLDLITEETTSTSDLVRLALRDIS